MLIQIVTHTPVYVWAILAVLIFRGVAALSEREFSFKKLFIIPVIMLVLSLQDVGGKFGFNVLPLAAWAAGAATMLLLVWNFSGARITLGAAPDSVRVRGSWAPLAMMMSIFFTKYITAVSLAMHPQAAQNVMVMLAICILYGAFNGYFLGRLLRDMVSFQALRSQGQVHGLAPAAL